MNDADLREKFARLDERQRAAEERATRSEASHERALNLAVQQVDERRKADWLENQRRLTELNNEAGRLKEMNSITVSRELFDTRIGEIFTRLEKSEGNARERAGQSRLPDIAVAALVTATITAAIVWAITRFLR